MNLFGFSKRDITPEVGCYLYGYVDNLVSESVHDPLSVSALYFESEKESSLMLSAEVCSINSQVSEKIRRRISEKTGVKAENIILHGIHNHTGPNTDGNTGWGDLDTEYCENVLLPNAVAAAEEAKLSAVPAKVGYNMGESKVAVNRRQQTINNDIILGQCEWGCFDPRMAIFAFSDEKGKPIANLIYYTCHGTCAGQSKAISRDWAGGMIDALEEFSGAPAAFFCGPEGDVGPRLSNGHTVGTMKDAQEMGMKAGQDAIGIYKGIKEFVPLEMKVKSGELRLPLKSRIPMEDALEKLMEVRDKTVNIDGQIRHYCERVLKSYEENYREEKYTVVAQTVISLGKSIFVSFPYELFSEIALRINREKTDAEVFSLSNANGSEGYFPTDSEISKGGYEINMYLTHNIQPFSDNADWSLIKETLKNLEDLSCTE